MLFDTHAHYDDERFDGDREALLATLREIAPFVLQYAQPVWKRLKKVRRAGAKILFEGAQGVLLGAQVKIEESVADNEIFVGDPQRVVCNMVQDVLIEQDKDIKTHTNIYAGYARAESALLDDLSFAILTVKQV